MFEEDYTNEANGIEPIGLGCAIIIAFVSSALLCGVAYLIVKIVSGI